MVQIMPSITIEEANQIIKTNPKVYMYYDFTCNKSYSQTLRNLTKKNIHNIYIINNNVINKNIESYPCIKCYKNGKEEYTVNLK